MLGLGKCWRRRGAVDDKRSLRLSSDEEMESRNVMNEKEFFCAGLFRSSS